MTLKILEEYKASVSGLLIQCAARRVPLTSDIAASLFVGCDAARFDNNLQQIKELGLPIGWTVEGDDPRFKGKVAVD